MVQQDKEGRPSIPAQGLETAHPIASNTSPNSAAKISSQGSSPTTTLQRQARSVTTKGGIGLASKSPDSLKMSPGLRDKARPSPPSTLRLPEPSTDQRHFLLPSTSFKTLEELEQRASFLRHSIDFTNPPDSAPFITHRFPPHSTLPRANSTCSLLSISQPRKENTYYETDNLLSRSLSARNLEERPSSRASTTSDLRTVSRSGSPTVRRVRPPGSLYLDYQAWLAGEQKQTNQPASQGSATAQSDPVEPIGGQRTASRSTERSREGSFSPFPQTLPKFNPQLPSPASTIGPKTAPSSLSVRSPSTKGRVVPRASRIPSDTTIRGVNTNDRTLSAPSASSIVNRKSSGHAGPTIASQLKVKEKITPPRTRAPTTSFVPKTISPPRSINPDSHEVTQHAGSSLASRDPFVDSIGSQKLKKMISQPPSSSECSPSPTPTKDTRYLARRKDLRLAQGSGSSTMADSDSPLYSPVSPTTKQASPLHEECRQVLQELQRIAEADKTTQETMKECIAEFARCQVRKDALVKRVEDLLDRAQYYKTLASSIHGDEVQLYGEHSCDEVD